jgi:hypothetical protein
MFAVGALGMLDEGLAVRLGLWNGLAQQVGPVSPGYPHKLTYPIGDEPVRTAPSDNTWTSDLGKLGGLRRFEALTPRCELLAVWSVKAINAGAQLR